MSASGRLLVLILTALAIAGCQHTQDFDSRLVASAEDAAGAATSPLPESQGSRLAAAPDAREAESSGGQHFIEFRSRYAYSYGHTFVIFGRLDAAGNMIDPEVAGLHPATDSPIPYLLGHVVPVPAETGASDGDLDDEYMSAQWRILLSKAEYDEVVANIREIQARSPVWHAPTYNCNAFAAEIAKSMGYRTPFILLMPEQFVTTLREMNTGSGRGRTAETAFAPADA